VTDTVTVSDIEICKPGVYTDANGTKIVVTLDTIAEMAAAYDPDLLDAPGVVGHPKTDDPAYGWMRNLRVEGEILLCDLVDVDPEFAETLKAKRYKHKSLSFWRPTSPGNPMPGKNYPKHLGLLGAKAPAVRGLKPIALSAADDGAVIIELAAPEGWHTAWAFRGIAAVLGRLRDALIAEKGVEAADAIFPAYVADDIRAAAAECEPDVSASDEPINFSEFDTKEPGMTEQELQARAAQLDAREAALKARETGLGEREAALAAHEAETRAEADAAFVEDLIKQGRLAPGEKDMVLAELAAMDDGEAVIEFTAGDGAVQKLSRRQAFQNRLKRAPIMVTRGEFDMGDAPAELATGEDIAAAALAYQDEEKKAGRVVGAQAAVAHVMQKRS
jgi:hypothetical protein